MPLSPVHVVLPKFLSTNLHLPLLALHTLSFPFCNPSIIPLLSTCTLIGPITLDIRPANIEELFLRPTFPSQKDLPGHIAMLFAPFLPHFLSQESWTWFERCSFVQLFVFVLCCPLFPAHRSGRPHQHLLNIFPTHKPHVKLYLITDHQCVPARPFYTQITGLTHHRTCRPSHLFPRLNFLNLPHPRFLFAVPFSRPDSFCPALSGQGRKFLLHFQAKGFMDKDKKVLFLPGAAAICLLNLNLSVGAIPTAWATQVIASTIPARNSFLTPASCNSVGKLYAFYKRKPDFAHLSSRFFFRSKPSYSRSQVYSEVVSTPSAKVTPSSLLN